MVSLLCVTLCCVRCLALSATRESGNLNWNSAWMGARTLCAKKHGILKTYCVFRWKTGPKWTNVFRLFQVMTLVTPKVSLK